MIGQRKGRACWVGRTPWAEGSRGKGLKCIARNKIVLGDEVAEENRGFNVQGTGSQEEESASHPKD